MGDITARTTALRALRLLGIVSLDPDVPTDQAFPIEPTDLDDVVGVMNSALQDYSDTVPLEAREKNLGAVLHAPTQVFLNATNGSTIISGFGDYASWMAGCTISIAGDSQQNELTSNVELVSPYGGTSGTNIEATVYGDCVQIPEVVSKVLVPVSIPNQIPLLSCSDRLTFMRLSGYPLVTNPDGSVYGYPFFWFVQKIVQRPLFWYLEGAYQTGISYVPRRIRVGPMPDQTYQMTFKAAMNSPNIESSDIDDGDHVTDPMTFMPIQDGHVESLLFPLICQKMTGLAQFKNDGTKAEIGRAYVAALGRMRGIRAQGAPTFARYV